MKTKTLLLCALFLPGCIFIFDEDDKCRGGGGFGGGGFGGGAPQEATTYRNPNTGLCEYLGGGGGYDECGNPVPVPGGSDTDLATIALPAWALCGPCESLDPAACVESPECRQIIITDIDAGFDDGIGRRLECWGVAPGPAIEPGCEVLDAVTCSQRNDCSAVYETEPDQLRFVQCIAESQTQPDGCYSSADCSNGTICSTELGDCQLPPGCEDGMGCPAVCYGQCVPPQNTCAATLCVEGTTCVETCSVGPDGIPYCRAECVPNGLGCYSSSDCPAGSVCSVDLGQCGTDPSCPDCDVCYGQCIPQNSCAAVTCQVGQHCEEYCGMDPNGPSCQPVCVDDQPACANMLCGPGTHCAYSECGIVEFCESDAGYCYGAVADLEDPPSCPAGTVPGVLNSRYTGFCIPEAQCLEEPVCYLPA